MYKMPKFPPLKDNTKAELHRMPDYEKSKGLDESILRTIKSKQKSRFISECPPENCFGRDSPCKRNRKKGLGTPKLTKMGSSKGIELFNACCLPTITENKHEKVPEHNRSKINKTSLTKLHEQSLSDKKSMAFWRRYGHESRDSKKNYPDDGKQFERGSLYPPSSKTI